MHKIIEFPKSAETKYFKTHWLWFAHVAKQAGWRIKPVPFPKRTERGFIVRSNGIRILIDHSDLPNLARDIDEFKLCFKYHWNEAFCLDAENVHPWSPISFNDWDVYNSGVIKYTGETQRIAANQSAYAGARARRQYVRELLTAAFGRRVDHRIYDQLDYWNRAAAALVSVHVPGQRNDILDRGQLQLMAFGVPTISPNLTTRLVDGDAPIAHYHYIRCNPDYSDIENWIDHVDKHPYFAAWIGANAESMFRRCCVPDVLMAHFESKLNEVINGIS